MQQITKMHDEHTINDVYKLAGNERTDKLLEMIEEKALVTWFYTPNKVFENRRPIDLCNTNEAKRLDQMIAQLEEGFSQKQNFKEENLK